MAFDHIRCDRCGERGIVAYADSICRQCPHVPLCVECWRQHRAEAEADGTAIDYSNLMPRATHLD